jgi:hypothetical protein
VDTIILSILHTALGAVFGAGPDFGPVSVLALCAARSAAQRAQLYLRYGAAILLSGPSERLQNLHRHILTLQFPEWKWELFRDEVEKFIDCLKLQGRLRQKPRYRAGRIRQVGRRRKLVRIKSSKFKPFGLSWAVSSGEIVKEVSGLNIHTTAGGKLEVVIIYKGGELAVPIEPYFRPKEQKQFEIEENLVRS